MENRLISASGAKTANLIYDPLGRLYETNQGGAAKTRFIYDGDALVLEYDQLGTIKHRYVHGSGVDDPLVWYDGGTVNATNRRHMFANWQGSITAITDASGNVVQVNAYDAYGIPNDTNLGRFQYTGQMIIPELGIYHYKARAYSPYLGRFLQTDPIGYEDQYNLYVYVANDPVGKTDPTGLKCNDDGTECSSDNFDETKARVDVEYTSVQATAVSNSKDDFQPSSDGEPTGLGLSSPDYAVVVPTDSQSGTTSTGETAKFDTTGADFVVHGHNEGTIVDDPASNRGYGDTQSLETGRPTFTVEGDRVGVHDAPGGHLRFKMTEGTMTKSERRQIQRNLNRQQRVFQRPKPRRR